MQQSGKKGERSSIHPSCLQIGLGKKLSNNSWRSRISSQPLSSFRPSSTLRNAFEEFLTDAIAGKLRVAVAKLMTVNTVSISSQGITGGAEAT